MQSIVGENEGVCIIVVEKEGVCIIVVENEGVCIIRWHYPDIPRQPPSPFYKSLNTDQADSSSDCWLKFIWFYLSSETTLPYLSIL